MSFILRKLQGGNLEVFKFGTYILFPIGWMYYFGTNLDDRFRISGFWPSAEQSHKIPLEKEEIDNEIARMRKVDMLRRERRRMEREDAESQGRGQDQGQGQGQVQATAE